MTVGGGFRRLTRILRRIESVGWAIDSVESDNGSALCSRNEIRVRLLCSHNDGETPESDQCSSVLTSELAGFDSCECTLGRFESDPHRGIVAELVVSVQIPDRKKPTTTAIENREHVPLYRNRERLQRLYDDYNTFTAMAEAVDDGVSAETIRRYTIEHGIHQPGSDDDTEPPAGENGSASDVGRNGKMRDDGQVREVMRAVEEAYTLYDVQRSLELDRDETVALLRDLDLLDLVVGRLDRDDDLEQRRDIVRERVNAATGDNRVMAAGRNR